MRKHQEGYVLVYVMVAVVLLSLLGAVSCEIAVSNLKAQQASIDRMKDEYVAEGVIEAFCAKLVNTTDIKEDSIKYGTVDSAQEAVAEKFRDVIAAIFNSLKQDPDDGTEKLPLTGNWDTIDWTQVDTSDSYTAKVELALTTVQEGSTAAVETTVQFTLTLKLKSHYGAPIVDSEGNVTSSAPFEGYTYTVTVSEPTYQSFTHTTVEGGEGTQSDGNEPQTGDETTNETLSGEEAQTTGDGEETQKTSEGSALSAGSKIEKVCEQIKGEYGDIKNPQLTKQLARNVALDTLKAGVAARDPQVTITWSKITWTTTGTNDTTTTSTATPTLTLSCVENGETIKATVKVELNRKLEKKDLSQPLYNGSSSFSEGYTTYYVCTITAGEPTLLSVERSAA